MNKQQLASRIWESANRMRSKIEANEYKDYILGFIFYKFLSDKEEEFLRQSDFTDENMENVLESNQQTVNFVQKKLGYFIAYPNLFSNWLKMGKKFDISNVRDGLSAFSRLIDKEHKKLFEKIFDTLQTGLKNLGDTSANQTKAVRQLLKLIKDIPMDGRQGYDVLGFIYEYLISMFAANAGKKAGEFYTPHEASLLMSEIIAEHLKNREEIKIYDPTSGSGSLLINIGSSVAKNMQDPNKIMYYAQELKANTYNLTRMNLIMRGILVDNIYTRNGDTLEDDWPMFDETDPDNTYQLLHVDAVVSNPPYSQKWDTDNKDNDQRFADYGVAPKGKADYAFLLHDLYHLKPDGIMTIVLPHGVLFRGAEEGKIRASLIEHNNIDAIIGLPANMFFGTGIPTIIMVLKQKRINSDVLIIDASKGYSKEGTKNKLRACDIKKIVDVVRDRISVKKFSRVVTREEIRQNEYNLNIPRYVDSSDDGEQWNIYATMFGGIPKDEVEKLEEFWQVFSGLKEELFVDTGTPFLSMKTDEIIETINENAGVKEFLASYLDVFSGLDDTLKDTLIYGYANVNIPNEENTLSSDLFNRLSNIPLVDKYRAYQSLDDSWITIANDLEILQTEGFDSAKQVDPIMILKIKDGDSEEVTEKEEVQDGWKGHLVPFELVQKTLLPEQYANIKRKENEITGAEGKIEEIMDSFTEEEKNSTIFNNEGTELVAKEFTAKLKEIYADVDTPEVQSLKQYLTFTKKADKLEYISTHQEIDWAEMKSNKDGTYGKQIVTTQCNKICQSYVFPEDSFEAKVTEISKLLQQTKSLKAQLKEERSQLDSLTKETIENLTNDQINELLKLKWIDPLISALMALPNELVHNLANSIKKIEDKYKTTYSDIVTQEHDTADALVKLIDDLDGDEFDEKGLKEFQSFLKGEKNE